VSADERGRRVAYLPGWDHLDFDFVVTDNTLLNDTWSRFKTPIIQYTTIESDGYGEGNTFLIN
jgi:hypothetical protein